MSQEYRIPDPMRSSAEDTDLSFLELGQILRRQWHGSLALTTLVFARITWERLSKKLQVQSLTLRQRVVAICQSHSDLCPLLKDADCGSTFVPGDRDSLAEFLRFFPFKPQLGEEMRRSDCRHLNSHSTPKTIAQQYLQVSFSSLAARSPEIRQFIKLSSKTLLLSFSSLSIGHRLRKVGFISEAKIAEALSQQRSATNLLRFRFG